MRIYYDGPDALVTESHFVWFADPHRLFSIAELRDVRLVQRDVSSPRTITVLASVAAAALIVAPGWLVLDTVIGRLVLLGAAVLAVSLATLRRRNEHQWELRAVYRAREVTLYTTLEMRTFNQVTRALRRAVEARAPGQRRTGVATA